MNVLELHATLSKKQLRKVEAYARRLAKRKNRQVEYATVGKAK